MSGGQTSLNRSLLAALKPGRPPVDINEIKELLTLGASANARKEDGESALDIAIPKLELVKLLLDHGADINYNGGSYGPALSQAIFMTQERDGSDTEPLLRELLLRGADPNIQGGKCLTPLQTVVSLGPCPEKFVGILVNAGARIELVEYPYRDNVEVILMRDELFSNIDIFRNLAANVLGWRIKIANDQILGSANQGDAQLIADLERRLLQLPQKIHHSIGRLEVTFERWNVRVNFIGPRQSQYFLGGDKTSMTLVELESGIQDAERTLFQFVQR